MPNNLYIRIPNTEDFKLVRKRYETYRDAVEAGRDLGGSKNFYVDTGTRIPSREEQLLLPLVKKVQKKRNYSRGLTKKDRAELERELGIL